jgi:hypothetical protein
VNPDTVIVCSETGQKGLTLSGKVIEMPFNIQAAETRTYTRYEDVELDEIPKDVADAVEEMVEAVQENPAQRFTIGVDEKGEPDGTFADADEANKTWGEFLSYGRKRPKGKVELVRERGTKKTPVPDTVLRFRVVLPESPDAA